MALAVAEQLPGVQECWEAAQAPVDISSGQGYYGTRWEMGNKVDLNLPPSVCSGQKGVQGVVSTQKPRAVWHRWDGQLWVSSAGVL